MPYPYFSTWEFFSFKKGILNEYKYFLNDYLGSVKTKLKENPAFKRIFRIILNRLFRKLNFLIPMVDFAPSPHFISQVTPMVHTMCIMLTRLLEKCNVEHTHWRYWEPSFYCTMRNNVGVQHTDGSQKCARHVRNKVYANSRQSISLEHTHVLF
jgi:hypothetical protein